MKHHGHNSHEAGSTRKGNSNQIKAQEISLPKAGGTIQSAGEKVEVQEFTGSSSFTIPLPVSPCRNIAPSLAVSYSTGGGNSSFGLGFNVGMPRISRKTSKGIPKYDNSDTFL